jgi:hypothetical protein
MLSGGSSIAIPMSGAQRFLDEIRPKIQESLIEDRFKDTALSDLREAGRAYGSTAFKACVIMLGAVLEGLMLGTLRRSEVLNVIRSDPDLPGDIGRRLGGLQKPEYHDDKALADALADKLSFEDYRVLICRCIPEIEQEGVQGIQHFRNAVHPWKVVQTPNVYGDYDEARAMQHLTSLSILANRILSWNP